MRFQTVGREKKKTCSQRNILLSVSGFATLVSASYFRDFRSASMYPRSRNFALMLHEGHGCEYARKARR